MPTVFGMEPLNKGEFAPLRDDEVGAVGAVTRQSRCSRESQ